MSELVDSSWAWMFAPASPMTRFVAQHARHVLSRISRHVPGGTRSHWKFTAEVVVPSSRSEQLAATSGPDILWAQRVEPPMCGEDDVFEP